MRAGGAFVTSLLAAAMLAIGPAVVIAKIGAGAPVVVALSVAVPRLALPFAASQHDVFVRWLRRRPPYDWRARGVMFVAGAPGSPRGRTHDAGVKPRRTPGPGNGGPARRAAHRLRWRPAAGESLPLARRQRPPPPRARPTLHHDAELIALAPATPPLVWWCGPIFLSLRV
jgi:hypothetical protein